MNPLQKIIPFQFRVGSGVGKYTEQGQKKIYEKYTILAYIDSRDVENVLDDNFADRRECVYQQIGTAIYCGIGIDGKRRWNCGTGQGEHKDKSVASDAFKRAGVKRGIGRFLHSVPFFTITRQEVEDNKYDITGFAKKKFSEQLKKRYDEYNKKHGLTTGDVNNVVHDSDIHTEEDLPDGDVAPKTEEKPTAKVEEKPKIDGQPTDKGVLQKKLFALWGDYRDLLSINNPDEIEGKYAPNKKDSTRKATMNRIYGIDSTTNMSQDQISDFIKKIEENIQKERDRIKEERPE